MASNYNDLRKPGYQLGPYTVEKLIGEGGMGEVYKGYETTTHRPVALKIISQSQSRDKIMVQRFLNEGKALTLLNCPNIVTVYAVGEFDGLNYIAMEYIEGRSLADICANYALPGPEAVPLVIQMLKGLEALSAKSIVHRDLKPQNIIFQKDNLVKILDLGIAKVYGTQTLGATSTGVIVGTVQYLAPELAAGQPATVVSDMWSIGAIFYEMVCGTPLIRAGSAIEALRKLATLKITFPPEIRRLVDPELQLIIQRFCDPIPQKRFGTPQQAIAELENYAKTHPATGLWLFKFIGSQLDNAETIKDNLLKKGFRPLTVKRILAEAITETDSHLVEPDTDKTLSLTPKTSIEINEASLREAISRLKVVRDATPEPIRKPSNRLAWSITATVAVLITSLVWLKWGKRWLEARRLQARTSIQQSAPVASTVPQPNPVAVESSPPAPAQPAVAPTPEPSTAAVATPVDTTPAAETTSPESTAEQKPQSSKSEIAKSTFKKESPALVRPKIKNRSTTLVLEYAPTGDRNPSAELRAVNAPQLTWEETPEASRYRVEVATDKDFKKVIKVTTATSPTYRWEEITPGQFYWRVRAASGSNQSSAPSEVAQIRAKAPAPQLPAKIQGSAISGATAKVTFNWSPVPFAKKYRISVFADPKGNDLLMEKVTPTPAVQLDLAAGRYWVSATATDLQAGAISDRSPASAIIVTNLESLSVPELLSPPEASSLFLSDSMPVPMVFYWKVTPQTTLYEIQVARDTSFTKPVLAMAHTSNRLIVKQKFKPGEYFWRVRSKSATAESGWSTPRSLKIESGD